MNTRSSARIKIPGINELPLSESDLRMFEGIELTKKDPKPAQIRGSWSPEDDEALLSAVRMGSEEKIRWELVAAKVGNHTPKQCRERYLVKLNPDVRRSPFEKWEDDLIQSERQRIGNHWSVIAQLLPGRTSCSVKNRWYTVLRYKEMVPNVMFGMGPAGSVRMGSSGPGILARVLV